MFSSKGLTGSVWSFLSIVKDKIYNLSGDQIMKKIALIFVAMILLAISLAACGGAPSLDEVLPQAEVGTVVSEEISLPVEVETLPPEEALDHYAGDWVTITAELGGGISISIPSTWQSYEHIPAPGTEPFSRLLIYGEGVGGLIELSIHESPISLPSMILDEFYNQEPFQFDDGYIGYMAEDYRGLVWIHCERGILDIYFRHGGNRGLFTDNEYLILNTIRSLRYNQ